MARRRTTLLVALGLALAVGLLYAPVRHHGWVDYDDPVYLTENAHVARGLDWSEVGWVFTHELAANYHPLTWVAHMLDVQFFGLEPGPHHLVSVALHALNTVLALLLFRALSGSLGAAALGAALFGLHPLRVESVAWASERKDVLCATFFLVTLLAYLRYARAPSLGRYLLVCLAFALALLSKPTAVMFPCVALLLDAWPLARLAPLRRALLEKLPLFALAGLAALVTLWAQARGGSTSSLSSLAPGLRLLNAFSALGTYLAKTVWPVDLAVFYPHAAILSAHPACVLAAPALLGAALLLGLSWLAWRLRRSAPAVAIGWSAFLLLLLPVLGLVQVGTQACADRYTYLPALGLVGVPLGALAALGARASRPMVVGAGLLVALLAGVTRHQLAFWSDTASLFQHALAVTERNYVAHMKLGELAMAEGATEEAAAAFRRALEIDPNYVEALNNLALCQLDLGAPDEARALLLRAQRLDPADFDTELNLGAVELERGELDAARRHFEACQARAPEDPSVLFDLGHLCRREGRDEEAERFLRRVVALDATHLSAWSNLGQVLLARGQTEPAVEAFERVLSLDPEDSVGHFNLGIALRKAGRDARAAEELRRALELDPGLELAREALHELDGAREAGADDGGAGGG